MAGFTHFCGPCGRAKSQNKPNRIGFGGVSTEIRGNSPFPCDCRAIGTAFRLFSKHFHACFSNFQVRITRFSVNFSHRHISRLGWVLWFVDAVCLHCGRCRNLERAHHFSEMVRKFGEAAKVCGCRHATDAHLMGIFPMFSTAGVRRQL